MLRRRAALAVEILGGFFHETHSLVIKRLEGARKDPVLGQLDGLRAVRTRLSHRRSSPPLEHRTRSRAQPSGVPLSDRDAGASMARHVRRTGALSKLIVNSRSQRVGKCTLP